MTCMQSADFSKPKRWYYQYLQKVIHSNIVLVLSIPTEYGTYNYFLNIYNNTIRKMDPLQGSMNLMFSTFIECILNPFISIFKLKLLHFTLLLYMVNLKFVNHFRMVATIRNVDTETLRCKD